jgi:hypothetical protein
MTAAWMLLAFAICPANGRAREEGQTIARDCATAERFLRAGLRPNQTLEIHECRPLNQHADWPRG